VAETMREIVYNLKITGGGTGLTMPITKSPLPFFYLMLAILVAATLVNWWLSASRFGYGLIAIREDEDAAMAMGINTALYKTAPSRFRAPSPASWVASSPTGSPSSIPTACSGSS
jgi:branched-chain amino acid transport system permease protein